MYNLKTIAIDMGHNVSVDIGASGIKQEDELNRYVGLELIDKLRKDGVNVVNCTPASASSLTDSLRKRCDTANNAKADIFVSIHHNACPGGEGTEALCITGGMSEAVSCEILKEIASLGYRNRGAKNRRDLYVINNTVMPAIIVECAFVDSPKDMARYDYRLVATAIYKGLKNSISFSNNVDSTINHTVIAGENLYHISKIYGVSVESIVNKNNIKNPNLIYVGQVLRIK